ncbi:MAG: bifunctional DNA-formamidopyrimidine glycosylase/DNA-(apurinic or apyrimidinic site) lyase [Acidobacteria bacterium]|nr:bifunctional DNA-formamidopyrimidine glycosylase/DNA-(apurinic or apyrimidinic site) lyase [Acidobacteriota bacterium]
MPEMPEVETLVRKLRKTVTGKRIVRVSLSGLSLRRPVSGTFAAKLQGRTIRRIQRRGKYIVIELAPRIFWLVHLGMSGRLRIHPQSFHCHKHTHAVIRFSDASVLEYRDPRRFGLLAVYEVAKPEQIPEIRSIGKDPLMSGFDDRWLQPMLLNCRRELKSFLLDQKKVAGLGNIYVCEALYLAGIHPSRRCYTLELKEVSRLVAAIRQVLRRAVRHRGTSFSDFIDLEGNPGKNQYYLNVFKREGESCVHCGNAIHRIRQGNRSTFLCSYCQK